VAPWRRQSSVEELDGPAGAAQRSAGQDRALAIGDDIEQLRDRCAVASTWRCLLARKQRPGSGYRLPALGCAAGQLRAAVIAVASMSSAAGAPGQYPVVCAGVTAASRN
jgi:hypothetical protein